MANDITKGVLVKIEGDASHLAGVLNKTEAEIVKVTNVLNAQQEAIGTTYTLAVKGVNKYAEALEHLKGVSGVQTITSIEDFGKEKAAMERHAAKVEDFVKKQNAKQDAETDKQFKQHLEAQRKAFIANEQEKLNATMRFAKERTAVMQMEIAKAKTPADLSTTQGVTAYQKLREKEIAAKLQADIDKIQSRQGTGQYSDKMALSQMEGAMQRYKNSILQLNEASKQRITVLNEQKAKEEQQIKTMLQQQQQLLRNAEYTDKQLAEFKKQSIAEQMQSERLYTEYLQEQKNKQLQIEQRELDVANFNAKASYNERYVMYADMLRHMEERDRLHAEKIKADKATKAAKESFDEEYAQRQSRVVTYSPNNQYNYATGQSTYRPTTTSSQDFANQALQIRNEVLLENAIREQGAQSNLAKQLRYKKQLHDVEMQYQEKLKEIEHMRSQGAAPARLQAMHTEALDQYHKALQKVETLTNIAVKSHTNLFIRIGEIIGAYRLYNAVLNTTINALQAIPKIGIELESTKASLLATTGSLAGAGSALSALDAEAHRTGIEIKTLWENFRGFEASTSIAGASLDSTWKMFTNLDTVITGLHLSADKANGIFLAMAQIFNKGKVQSEELVKQLGNLLPGAFAAFAESMDITTQELSKRMKAGTVFAQDTMENFTEYYKKKFAVSFTAAADGLNANIGRMNTSFTHLGEAIYESTKGSMNNFVKGVASLTDSLTAGVKAVGDFSHIFSGALYGSLALGGAALLNYIANLKLFTASATVATTTISAFIAATSAGEAKILAQAAAMNVLKSSWAFLSSPVTILAGIAAITAALVGMQRSVQQASENLRTSINASIREAAAIQNAEGDPVAMLKIKTENADSVIKAKEKMLAAQKEVKDKETAIADIKDPTLRAVATRNAGLDIAKQKQLSAEKFYENVYKVEEKNAIQQIKDKDMQSREMLDEALAASEGLRTKVHKTIEDAAKDAAYMYDKRKDVTSALATAKRTLEIDEAARDPSKRKPHQEIPMFPPSAEDIAKSRQTIANVEEGRVEAIEKAKADFLAKQNKGAGAANAAIKKEERIGFAEEKSAIDISAEKLKASIKELDKQYKMGLVSIANYYDTKQKLELNDLLTQEDHLQKELAIARKANDVAKYKTIQGNLKELGSKREQITSTVETERYGAEKDFRDKLEELQALVYKNERETKAYKVAEFDSKHADLKQRMVAEHMGTGLYERGRALTGYQGATSEIESRVSEHMAEYNAKTQNIQSKMQIGELSPLAAQIEHIDAAKAAYAKLNEELLQYQKENDEFLRLGERIPAQNLRAVDELQQKMSSLKQEATSIGAVFANQVGRTFESSFANVITGAANAKQAFRSFAISVQQEIANIVAQELKSALFKGLGLGGGAGGGLFSMLGGLFGLGGAAAGAATGSGMAAFTAASSKSIGGFLTSGLQPNANGGVYTSSSLSKHSGTIVDTPTLFKFASGSTGLMGEAGAEAILPLRKKNGVVGVVASGAGSAAGVNIGAMHITVQSSGANDPTGSKQAELIAKTVKQQLVTLIQQQTANNMRAGNLLNPTAATANI